MATIALFRTCPRTGLQFHQSAETLIKVNAVAAVVSLLVGGVLALLILLTRWQWVHLIDAENFYMTLTVHGLDMLAFWIIFFEIAILYFCSSTLLRSRLATPRMASTCCCAGSSSSRSRSCTSPRPCCSTAGSRRRASPGRRSC